MRLLYDLPVLATFYPTVKYAISYEVHDTIFVLLVNRDTCERMIRSIPLHFISQILNESVIVASRIHHGHQIYLIKRLCLSVVLFELIHGLHLLSVHVVFRVITRMLAQMLLDVRLEVKVLLEQGVLSILIIILGMFQLKVGLAHHIGDVVSGESLIY